MLALCTAHYCDHCNKSFARASILRDHRNAVKGIKPFRCRSDGCPEAFTLNNDLKVHVRERHSTSPPQIYCRTVLNGQLEGCSKIFKRKSDLHRHLKAPGSSTCRPSLRSTFVASKPSPSAYRLLDFGVHYQWERCFYRSYCAFLHCAMDAFDIKSEVSDPEIPLAYFDMVRSTRLVLQKPNAERDTVLGWALRNSAMLFAHPSMELHLNLVETCEAMSVGVWPPVKFVVAREELQVMMECMAWIHHHLRASLLLFADPNGRHSEGLYTDRLRQQSRIARFAAIDLEDFIVASTTPHELFEYTGTGMPGQKSRADLLHDSLRHLCRIVDLYLDSTVYPNHLRSKKSVHYRCEDVNRLKRIQADYLDKDAKLLLIKRTAIDLSTMQIEEARVRLGISAIVDDILLNPGRFLGGIEMQYDTETDCETRFQEDTTEAP